MRIVTERTLLRPLSPDDARDFYLLNQDEEVIRYTGDKPFSTIMESRRFLEGYDQFEKYGVGRMAVLHREALDFLGWCGLNYNPALSEYDIGFRFLRKFWNRGYATETAGACIMHGFRELKLQRIIGRAMKENAASIKVLEKIGMSFEKYMDFEEHPGVLYAINNKMK